MSQERINSEMSINLLMEITELNYDQAAALLATHNNSLDAALNSHLDGGNNFMDEDDDNDVVNGSNIPIAGTSSTNSTLSSTMTTASAGASTSAISNPLIQDDDNVRSPIPPKREILLLPDEDNFRFRKRRNVSHNICPLRNFQREGELQEQMLADAERHAEPSIARRSKRIRLEDLFLPPIDLSFCGSFQAARDYATAQNRWLIVNLQDNTEFASQALNRDIWREQIVFDMIKKYFVFWQIGIDNTEGARFQSFYSANIIPYVCIIDPRTGEEKLGYKKVFKFTAKEFVNELRDYLREHSPFITLPNIPYGGGIYDVHFNDLNIEDRNTGVKEPSPSTSSSSSLSIHGSKTFNNYKNGDSIESNGGNGRFGRDGSQEKKKRKSLTETEQIALAIQNSIKERKKNCGDRADVIEIYDSDDGLDLTKDEEDIVAIYDINKVLKIEKDNEDDVNTNIDNKMVNVNEGEKNLNALNNSVNNVKETTQEEMEEGEEDPLNKLIEQPSKFPLTIIILRLPDNTRSVIEWPCTTKLLALNIYVKKTYPELTKESYKIMCPLLKQDILLMNDNLTLEEANLHPSVTLHIQQDN